MVAPTKMIVPRSMCGRKASCCVLLKRCTSSTNSTVRCALRRSATAASASTCAHLRQAGEHGRDGPELGVRVACASSSASVVLPQPGGPHRIIECTLARFHRAAQRRAGRQQALLADHFVERARAHALGQRLERPPAAGTAGAGGGARFLAALAHQSLQRRDLRRLHGRADHVGALRRREAEGGRSEARIALPGTESRSPCAGRANPAVPCAPGRRRRSPAAPA